MSLLQQKYKKELVSLIRKELGLKNVMQVPYLEKIILNIGVGSAASEPKKLEQSAEELTTISGQRSVKTRARKSIAGFKLREGMHIGCMVTLRGQRMYAFLARLIDVALPRVRDFRGINRNAFDGRGNYNLSIKEQTIFPEIDVDKVSSYHGMNITLVSNTKSDDESRVLLEHLGMPFRTK